VYEGKGLQDYPKSKYQNTPFPSTDEIGRGQIETFEKLLFTYLHELFDPSTGLLTKS
jgi:hypothetical protein